MVFNTPGANANGVKELVIAGMLMALGYCGRHRVVPGQCWEGMTNITKDTEKSKKALAGCRQGEEAGRCGLKQPAQRSPMPAIHLGMEV